jgi:hypothetical protein
MDGETVVAIIAAAVASTAMVVAVWQGYEARQSRKAAEKSAGYSNSQADSAVHAATAAREQVEIMRTQLEQEIARRDREDAPEFFLNPKRRKNGFQPITVTVTKCLSSVRVFASVVGLSESPEADNVSYGSIDEVVGGLQGHNLGPFDVLGGSEFDLSIEAPNNTDKIKVGIHLHSVERDGQHREWDWSQEITLKPPPQVAVF